MRVAALISGGKDSILALHRAAKSYKVACLITAFSDNPDSYMFHTDTVELTKLQADSMRIPLISFKTPGDKEIELEDLRKAMIKAKEECGVEGIVSGAIASSYQKTRINELCMGLNLESITPLWGQDPKGLLEEVAADYKAIVVKVAADGLDDKWLGRPINESFIKDISKLQVHPMGEGGEYESFVLKAPLFSKEIVIADFTKEWDGTVGHLRVKKAFMTP